jgi:hypothetical protein
MYDFSVFGQVFNHIYRAAGAGLSNMVYLPTNGRSIVLELTGNHHVTQIFQVLG